MISGLIYGVRELREGGTELAVWGWCSSKCSNIFGGGSGGRGTWETAIEGDSPGPTVVRRVEDPSLVRKLREAAGASSTVAVAVTVLEPGATGLAVAVQIEPEDVLGYLGHGRFGSVEEAVKRSGARAWFVGVYEEETTCTGVG